MKEHITPGSNPPLPDITPGSNPPLTDVIPGSNPPLTDLNIKRRYLKCDISRIIEKMDHMT